MCAKFIYCQHTPLSVKRSILEAVQDNQVVLLGEQTHGDGATLKAKVEIIQYLHEYLGFNTIAFESGLYDLYIANRDYQNGVMDVSIYNLAIGEIWSDTEEFQELLKYVDDRAKLGDTLNLIGFDSQEGQLFEEHFLEDFLNLTAQKNINLQGLTKEDLDKRLITKDIEDIMGSEPMVSALFDKLWNIANQLKYKSNLGFEERILVQAFKSQIWDLDYQLKIARKQSIDVQNPRDQQMADNFIFLYNQFPKEKILGWGASYHFSKNLKSISFDAITDKYLKQQDSLAKSLYGVSDYDGSNPLENGIPMAELVSKALGDKLYSLGFSSYKGTWGLVGDQSFPILKPPSNSIESTLAENDLSYTFVNLHKEFTETNYSSIFGNIPFKGNWGKMFDGLLFIKESFPPTIRQYGKDKKFKGNGQRELLSGRVINMVDGSNLASVKIKIVGTDKSYLTNQEGLFSIKLHDSLANNKIAFSTIGYKSDTLSVENLKRIDNEVLKIQMIPYAFEGVELEEVVVVGPSKVLSAEEIIRNARTALSDNYVFGPFNQKFYYKFLRSRQGDSLSGEEAIISTFHPDGMRPRSNPDTKIFGNIENVRSLGMKKLSNSLWDKIGAVSLMFNRDPIMSKTNVLHRTASYRLKKEGVVGYNGRKAFKIHFDNESPGSHSTGYGYPAPVSSYGNIYVDTESFAVISYEHCIIREPYNSKKNPDNLIRSSHYQLFTYGKEGTNYILEHANVVDRTIISSVSDQGQKQIEILSARDLLNIDFEDIGVVQIKQPLYNATRPKKDDSNSKFWENSSYILTEERLQYNDCGN